MKMAVALDKCSCQSHARTHACSCSACPRGVMSSSHRVSKATLQHHAAPAEREPGVWCVSLASFSGVWCFSLAPLASFQGVCMFRSLRSLLFRGCSVFRSLRSLLFRVPGVFRRFFQGVCMFRSLRSLLFSRVSVALRGAVAPDGDVVRHWP